MRVIGRFVKDSDFICRAPDALSSISTRETLSITTACVKCAVVIVIAVIQEVTTVIVCLGSDSLNSALLLYITQHGFSLKK